MYEPPMMVRVAVSVAWDNVRRGLERRDFYKSRDGRLMLRGIALTTDIGSDEEAYIGWLEDTALGLEMAAKRPRRMAA
ncbi:MAG TPA: hypothetical protein VLS27_00215 [Gammaproteobacteria bacterium]|nr:hypothetical protein [Gammaproteobacteria bacterium]